MTRADEQAKLILERYASGDTMLAIGNTLGVNFRTVRRVLQANGAYVPAVRVDREGLKKFMADGMPANWAAETLGMNYETARTAARATPGRRENAAEWNRVWSQIRNNSTLLELHRQFAPHGVDTC